MLLLSLAACSRNTCKFIQSSSAWHGQIEAKGGGKFISVSRIFASDRGSWRCLGNRYYLPSSLQWVSKFWLILFKNPPLEPAPSHQPHSGTPGPITFAFQDAVPCPNPRGLLFLHLFSTCLSCLRCQPDGAMSCKRPSQRLSVIPKTKPRLPALMIKVLEAPLHQTYLLSFCPAGGPPSSHATTESFVSSYRGQVLALLAPKGKTT